MEHAALAWKASFAAAAFFVVGMAVSILTETPDEFPEPPTARGVALAAAFTLFHLLLFPVVAALPALSWAKGAAYAWLVADNALIVLALFGEGEDVVTPLRWGLHLGAATWVFGASWSSRGALRWVGFALVLAFVGSTFAGPWLSDEAVPQSLGPAALLLVVWLVLVGMALRAQPHANPHPRG